MILKNLSNTHIIELIALALMLIGAVMISYYYITEDINKCTSKPLDYFISKNLDDKSITYVKINFYNNEGDIFPIDTQEFSINSKRYIRGLDTPELYQ